MLIAHTWSDCIPGTQQKMAQDSLHWCPSLLCFDCTLYFATIHGIVKFFVPQSSLGIGDASHYPGPVSLYSDKEECFSLLMIAQGVYSQMNHWMMGID